MTDEYPPVYPPAVRERIPVVHPIQADRTFQGDAPGIHLLIEGQSYFIPKTEARRVARRILFNVEE